MRLSYSILAVAMLFATQAQAEWMVRGRAVYTDPNERSRITPIGGQAKISNEFAPEIDISYFFNDNWAIEVPIGTVKHDGKAVNTSFGTLNSGSAWSMPAGMFLQYHYTDLGWAKPYAGAGPVYAIYKWAEDGAIPNLKVKNNLGWGWQVGVDVPVTDHWYWNADAKKLYVGADTRFVGSPVRAKIDLNPWIVGTGIGYRF